jgi:peptide/nickel transport system substrate-binding protein
MLGAVAAGLLPSDAASARDAVLVVVSPWEIRGLDPAQSGYVFLRLSVAETLVRPDGDGILRPGLSARWDTDADGLTWRFSLHADRHFHDLAPVTPQAVVDCLNTSRATTGNALRRVPIDAIMAEVGTVVIRLSRPFAGLLAYLAASGSIILGPGSYNAQRAVERIVATGPYRVIGMDGRHTIETQALTPRTGNTPAIRHVRYQAVVDGETRARMVEAGDADLAVNLPPVSADRLRRGRTARVLSMPVPRARYVALNLNVPPLGDLRVRQALSLAIDRTGAARAILRNPEAAADRLLPPFLREWHDPATPPLRTDPDSARRLLREAGWSPGPTGICQRDGQSLSLELFTYANRPELPILAEAMQAQWRDVGIEVRIRLGDSEDIPKIRADGSMQMALVARTYAQIPDPIGSITDDFVSPSPNGWASVGWRSEALENAVQRYTVTGDPAERQAAGQTIARVLQAELPVIPHSWYDQVVAFSRRVDPVAIDPFETTYGIPDINWAR